MLLARLTMDCLGHWKFLNGLPDSSYFDGQGQLAVPWDCTIELAALHVQALLMVRTLRASQAPEAFRMPVESVRYPYCNASSIKLPP